MITIVIPTYNEERLIMRTLDALFQFLSTTHEIRAPIRVVVADNGSTDGTPAIVRDYTAHEPRLTLFSISLRGKGNAIGAAWQRYLSDINVFLDADLSADLAALPELIRSVTEGTDIAIASRFVPGAVVTRSWGRRIFSRTLRLLLWGVFGLHVRDAPCGMKAVHRRVVEELVPNIRDRAWFFDTELLIRAERQGFRIVEIPVRWSDSADRDRPSRVAVWKVVGSYLLSIARLRFSL